MWSPDTIITGSVTTVTKIIMQKLTEYEWNKVTVSGSEQKVPLFQKWSYTKASAQLGVLRTSVLLQCMKSYCYTYTC